MSADFGIGKEVFQSIVGGVVAIAICVSIGSFIAQSVSHGPKHKEEPAAAAPAAEGDAAAAEGDAAKPAEGEAKPAEGAAE